MKEEQYKQKIEELEEEIDIIFTTMDLFGDLDRILTLQGSGSLDKFMDAHKNYMDRQSVVQRSYLQDQLNKFTSGQQHVLWKILKNKRWD